MRTYTMIAWSGVVLASLAGCTTRQGSGPTAHASTSLPSSSAAVQPGLVALPEPDIRVVPLRERAAGLGETTSNYGKVFRIPVVGGGGAARWIGRDLIVFAPHVYDPSVRQYYPVVYLLDGERAFGDPASGHVLGVDRFAPSVMATTGWPFLVVCIPSSGPDASGEYRPGEIYDSNAYGEEFLDFLLNEVQPRVRRTLRARVDSINTYIGGTGEAAVFAMWAATRRPDVFGGGFYAESPTLEADDGAAMSYFSQVDQWPERVYIGVGHDEPAGSVEAAQEVEQVAADNGVTEDRRMLLVTEGGRDWGTWSSRFRDAMRFFMVRPPIVE